MKYFDVNGQPITEINADAFVIPTGALTSADLPQKISSFAIGICLVNGMSFDPENDYIADFCISSPELRSDDIEYPGIAVCDERGNRWRAVTNTFIPVKLFDGYKEGDVVSINYPVKLLDIDFDKKESRDPISVTWRMNIRLAQTKCRYHAFGSFEAALKWIIPTSELPTTWPFATAGNGTFSADEADYELYIDANMFLVPSTGAIHLCDPDKFEHAKRIRDDNINICKANGVDYDNTTDLLAEVWFYSHDLKCDNLRRHIFGVMIDGNLYTGRLSEELIPVKLLVGRKEGEAANLDYPVICKDCDGQDVKILFHMNVTPSQLTSRYDNRGNFQDLLASMMDR